jgi:hypothetical protein
MAMNQSYRTIVKLNGSEEETLRLLTHYAGFVAEVFSSRSAQDLLECTVRSVLDATRAHSVVACLLDAGGNLMMSYGLDENNTLLHTQMEYPEPLIQQVRLWGEPLILSGTDPAELEQLGTTLRERGVVALVGIPLSREKSRHRRPMLRSGNDS